MLSDKITSFFFFKEDKVAFKAKKHIGYLKIFIYLCVCVCVCVCVYIYIYIYIYVCMYVCMHQHI